MEYILLDDHPHLKHRYKQIVKARRFDGTWYALFVPSMANRMEVHVERLAKNFTMHVSRVLNFEDDGEHFIVLHSSSLGYVVLARGKLDDGS